MRSVRTVVIAGLVGAGLVGALPATVRAQDTAPAAPAQPASPGPLVLERVESGIVVGPDVKFTDIDGDTGTLVGGYVGWLHHERLLIGGAGYWLVSGPGDIDMGYGGLLVGWNVNAGDRIRFGVRGLVGGGQATLSGMHSFPGRPTPFHDFRPGFDHPPGVGPGMVRVRWTDAFFVFEPQGILTVRLADGFGLDLGVGYRLIGGADAFDDRLRGVTGSIAIRFGH